MTCGDCTSEEICYFGEECIAPLELGDWCFENDDYCAEGLSCDPCSEICVFDECSEPWDCGKGEKCKFGKCISGEGRPGFPCKADEDCMFDLKCNAEAK